MANRHRGNAIRTRYALVVVYVIGVALSAANLFGVQGQHLTGDTIRSALVGGLVIVLVVAAVAVPWRLLQKYRGRVTNAPIVAGVSILIILWLLAILGPAVNLG